MMSFSEVCDGIVLLGAVTIALTNIYSFIKKPKEQIEQARKEEIKTQIKTTLEEEMPNIFLQHDLELHQQCAVDRNTCVENIKEEIIENIQEALDEISQVNLEQKETIDTLIRASKDVLRQRIMDIYNKYKFDKRMPIYMREALTELYKDYKAEGGNSYIDKYYNRMKEWEDYDDEGEEFLPI